MTSTKAHLPVILKAYVGVETETNARQLERYFKSGSGKAFASKRVFVDRAVVMHKRLIHLK